MDRHRQQRPRRIANNQHTWFYNYPGKQTSASEPVGTGEAYSTGLNDETVGAPINLDPAGSRFTIGSDDADTYTIWRDTDHPTANTKGSTRDGQKVRGFI